MSTTLARAVNRRPPAFKPGDRVVVIEDKFLSSSSIDQKIKARMERQVGKRGTVLTVASIGGQGGIPIYSVRLDHSRRRSVFFVGQLRPLDVVEQISDLVSKRRRRP